MKELTMLLNQLKKGEINLEKVVLESFDNYNDDGIKAKCVMLRVKYYCIFGTIEYDTNHFEIEQILEIAGNEKYGIDIYVCKVQDVLDMQDKINKDLDLLEILKK